MASEEEHAREPLFYEEAMKIEKLGNDIQRLEQEEKSLALNIELERRRGMARPAPDLNQDRYAEMMVEKARKLEKLKRQRQDLIAEKDAIDADLQGVKTDKELKPRPSILQSLQRWFPDRQEKLKDTDQVLDENILDKLRRVQPNSREVSLLVRSVEKDKQRLLQLYREHAMVLKEIEAKENGEPVAQVQIEIPSKRYLEEGRERLRVSLPCSDPAPDHQQEEAEDTPRSNLLPPLRDARGRPPSHEPSDQTSLAAPAAEPSWPAHEEEERRADVRRVSVASMPRPPEAKATMFPAMPMAKTTFPQMPPPALQRPTSLQEEIRQLRSEYLQQGGRNQALLEAIQGLERETLLAQDSLKTSLPLRSFSYDQPPRAGSEEIPAWFSEEMSKLERYIQERKAENLQLKAQLESLSAAPAYATERSDRREDVSFKLPLMEEEEELRQLELLPKNSAIYEMRKQHLKDVIEMKYKLQQLKQEAEKTELENQVCRSAEGWIESDAVMQIEEQRKEHERRKWVLLQQQQLLEAKYRKHFARENPIESLAGKEVQSESYNFEAGFAVFFDYILGLPSKVNEQVQVVFGFYLGQEPKTAPKALPMTDVDVAGISSRRAVLALKRQFLKVSLNAGLKLVVEVQSVNPATLGRGPKMVPVAWTMLPVFTPDDLNRGLFRAPAFMPPVRPDLEVDDVASLYRLKGMEFFLRLVPRQLLAHHDKFAVNPETTQSQYKYPPGFAPPADPPRPSKDQLATAPYNRMTDASPGPIPRTLSKPRPPSKLALSPAPSVRSNMAAVQAEEPAWPHMNFYLTLHEVDASLFDNSHCSHMSKFVVRISLLLLQDGRAQPISFRCKQLEDAS
eukprot:686899-Hanusia_phi.AAC.1